MRDDVVLHPACIDEVIGYLRDGTSVNLVGRRTAGRSTVLEQVSDRLESLGTSVVRIRGVRALWERPLAALALAGVQVPTTPNQLRTLTSTVDALADLLGGPSTVLMVDDADDLDATSVGAVMAVRARLATRVVTANRPAGRRHPASGALADLLQDGVRVTVDPLPFDGVHRLVHALLGHGVEPTAVARIAAVTGGLPGLVRAVVDTARRRNHLVLRDGLWVTRGDLWTSPLAQVVEPFLANLDDDAVDALSVLAHAGTVTVRTARRLIDPEALARLDDEGLIQVVPADEHLLGVFPPLLGDYLVQEGPVTRGLLAADRVTEAMSDAHGCHRAVPGPLPTPAPVVARLVTDHWSARRRELHRRWERDPSPAAGADLLAAMSLDGALPHEFETVLAGTRRGGPDADGRTRFLVHAALYRGVTTRSVAQAREVLAAGDDLPQSADTFAAVLDHLRLMVDSVPVVDPTVPRPPVHGTDAAAAAGQLIAAVHAQALVAAGQVRAGLALLDGLEPVEPGARMIVDSTRGLALLYSCRIDEAVRTALDHAERARQEMNPAALEAHTFVAGLGLAFQGRAVELDDLTCATLAMPTSNLMAPHLRTGLIALAAEAAAWQGRPEAAASLAHQASALDQPRGPQPYQASDLVAALIRDDDDPAAARATADQIWRVAAERLEHGYLPAGIVTGIAAIDQHPDPQRAAVLEEAAARCDAPLLTHMAEYAAAVCAQDPDRLAALEPVLRQAGMRQFAVRAAVARAVGLLAAGEPAAAIERADTAWDQAGLRGRDLCGLFLPFDRAVALTAREREVAVHVARGLSSPEIATRMVLSARTVEHHILSACRKVGVNSREGLARAARTWLSCTVR